MPGIRPTSRLSLKQVELLSSVIRLGDFYKFFATHCLTKVAQNFWIPFGQFIKCHYYVKSARLLFGQLFGDIIQLLVTLLLRFLVNF